MERKMSTLEIRGLKVSVETEQGEVEILKGVDLTIKSGETHAIMGPNGSGKSTLAYSIAGHPKYTITGGTVTLDGEDVLAMSVDERAKAGLFLAMQYPVEVPGVSVSNFLRTAATALRGEAPKLREWVGEVKSAMESLKMDPAFAQRNVNEGFSGGEEIESSLYGIKFEIRSRNSHAIRNSLTWNNRTKQFGTGWVFQRFKATTDCVYKTTPRGAVCQL